MVDYETYNSLNGEENGIYVYLPQSDGKWIYWSRIAQHGLDRIIADGGWYIERRGAQRTAVFVKDWGSGAQLLMIDGQYVGDDLVDRADLIG